MKQLEKRLKRLEERSNRRYRTVKEVIEDRKSTFEELEAAAKREGKPVTWELMKEFGKNKDLAYLRKYFERLRYKWADEGRIN